MKNSLKTKGLSLKDALCILQTVMLALLYLCFPCEGLAEFELPTLTVEGFLTADQKPYIYIGAGEGRWIYVDNELSVNVTRHEGEADNKKIIWYETEIKCTGETKLTSLLTTEGKQRGHSFRAAKEIANRYGAVLAFNDDFYASRWYNKKTQGIIIRNGEIMSSKTFKNDANAFPPLEVLALFEDGSMKAFKSKEHTAEEYLAMGVTDTYAFGPILVHEGALGERMYDQDYSPYREPRCALGMLESNHYIVLTVEGRTDGSRGARLTWLANKMLELGATEALNLDGGDTTYLIFMGEIINLSESVQKGRLRRVSSLLGIGIGKNGVVEVDE